MPKKHSLSFVKAAFEAEGYTPLFDTYSNSLEKLPFICDKAHKHQIEFKSFIKGHRCAVCFGNKRLSLESIRQYFIDEGYTPLFDSYTNAKQQLPFQCNNGHRHKITFTSWKSGVRCAGCSGNKRVSLEDVRQEFIDRGFTPLFTKYTNNHQLLDFVCGVGHSHKITLNSLRNGRGCGLCSVTLRRQVDDVKEEFVSAGLTPLFSDYEKNSVPLLYRCPNGHEHEISLSNLQKGQGCYKCSCAGFSKSEKEIAERFKNLGVAVEENTKRVIGPYELDLFFPDHKIAVEYCGLYWHSEAQGNKPNNYHYLKRKLCENKGIRLITVFEDEYLERPEVVFSRIVNALGITGRKIFARKCQVTSITNRQAADFLGRFHLQGASRARVSFGLFYNNQLVGVITGGSLSRPHVSDKARTIEMKRLCFAPGLSVVGGASKLFSRLLDYAKANNFEAVRSYQDMRYGNPWNSVYEHLGFKLIGETKYTPHYIKKQKRYRNQSLRKTPEERLTGKTEWQLRREQGFDRIWDCGHRTYEYILLNNKEGC